MPACLNKDNLIIVDDISYVCLYYVYKYFD